MLIILYCKNSVFPINRTNVAQENIVNIKNCNKIINYKKILAHYLY